jgi:hypothetical protein
MTWEDIILLAEFLFISGVILFGTQMSVEAKWVTEERKRERYRAWLERRRRGW